MCIWLLWAAAQMASLFILYGVSTTNFTVQLCSFSLGIIIAPTLPIERPEFLFEILSLKDHEWRFMWMEGYVSKVPRGHLVVLWIPQYWMLGAMLTVDYIIRRMRRRRVAKDACVQCGYESGLGKGVRCPECGLLKTGEGDQPAALNHGE